MAKIYVPADGACEILDDIDFMSSTQTIRFSLEGIDYEFDLSAANLQQLRDCLRPYIAISHIVGRDTTSQRNEVTSP
ncbi:Lsr2 dimerization domain-containing protein [Geodermatophilus sp. URMC 65]